MTGHPCAGHMATCDHCYLCDVVGVCCATVPQGGGIDAQAVELDRLRQAIVSEAASTPTLADRLRSEKQCPAAVRLLPPGPPVVAHPSSPDQEEKLIHVVAARTTR